MPFGPQGTALQALRLSQFFPSIGNVTSFLSKCRCTICIKNFRKSCPTLLGQACPASAATGVRNIFAAQRRDSTESSEEANLLCSAHISPSAKA